MIVEILFMRLMSSNGNPSGQLAVSDKTQYPKQSCLNFVSQDLCLRDWAPDMSFFHMLIRKNTKK